MRRRVGGARAGGHGDVRGTVLAPVDVLHVQIHLELALGRLKEVVEPLERLNVPLVRRQLVQVDLLVGLEHALHPVLLLLLLLGMVRHPQAVASNRWWWSMEVLVI